MTTNEISFNTEISFSQFLACCKLKENIEKQDQELREWNIYIKAYFISSHPHLCVFVVFNFFNIFSSTKRSQPYIVIQSGIIAEAIMNKL